MAKVVNKSIRYEPDEHPPHLTSIGVAAQAALLGLGDIAIVSILIVRVSGQEQSYLEWMVFATIVISGIGIILQPLRFGKIGGGHLLFAATSATFIPASIEALKEGGPSTLATMVVLSAPVNLLVAAGLPLLRRIITPAVAGTMLMLTGSIFVLVSLVLMAQEPSSTAAVVAGVTLAVITVLMLRSWGIWRLWAPIIGILVSCVVSVFVGLYDIDLVKSADWVGLPSLSAWPGFDMSIDAKFWMFLAVFILSSFANTIKNIGASVAVQQVSWRTARPVEYSAVQGSLNVDSITGLLSGFAAAPPITMTPDMGPLIQLTGVAARRVGVFIGIIYIIAAFFPKLLALMLAIPNPVVGAFLVALGGLTFMQGARIVIQDGADVRNATIVGLSLWLGVGFQLNLVFPNLFAGALHILFSNGVVIGGMTAVLMTLFMWLTLPSAKKLRTELNISSTSEVDEFLNKFASSIRWDEAASTRLRAAGEESLTALVNSYEESGTEEARKLLITVRRDEDVVEMEFIAGPSTENLEIRLDNLAERPDTEEDRDLSFRLLRHYASSIRHQSYHNVDIVTVRVEQT